VLITSYLVITGFISFPNQHVVVSVPTSNEIKGSFAALSSKLFGATSDLIPRTRDELGNKMAMANRANSIKGQVVESSLGLVKGKFTLAHKTGSTKHI